MVTSEVVLPLADLGEDLHRGTEAPLRVALGRGDYLRLGAAQEGVGGELFADSGWQCRLAQGSLAAFTLLAFGKRPVTRFHCRGECDVRERVFMSAIDTRFGRQCGELAEGSHHLRGCALEEATTAACEQGVAAEQQPVAYEGDVSGGVTRDVEGFEGDPEPGEGDV